MWRPKHLKVFEPHQPEYSLIDAMTQEVFENYSSEVYYWIFNRVATAEHQDELDVAYGEASRGTAEVYSGPFKVAAALQINPIIQELTKLGAQQIQEVDIYCNIAAMQDYLEGETPKIGDIMRVTWIESDNSRRYVFYHIANVTPVDIYNYRYTNWWINAEQTLLSNVPDIIRLHSDGE